MGYGSALKRIYSESVPRIVPRAAAALPQTDTDDIFTVSGGPIQMVLLYGRVTVNIGAVGNLTRLQYNPTSGAQSNITNTLEISGLLVDTLFGIGQGAAAMAGIDAGGILVMPQVMASQISTEGEIFYPGVIILNCAGDDGGGGRVAWFLWYIPVSAGGTVTAT